MLDELQPEELHQLSQQVKLSEAVASAKVQCARACNELCDTEEAYVETLQVIAEMFETPLSAWAAEEEAASTSGGLLTVEAKAIFGGVKPLLTVNEELLGGFRKAFQSCVGAYDPPDTTATGAPRGAHCAGELAMALANTLAAAAAGPLVSRQHVNLRLGRRSLVLWLALSGNRDRIVVWQRLYAPYVQTALGC